MSALTLAELTVGPAVAVSVTDRVRRAQRLRQAEGSFEVLDFDSECAHSYVGVYGAVLKAGRKAWGAQAVDLMIAATALAYRLPLYALNSADLRGLNGLIEIVDLSLFTERRATFHIVRAIGALSPRRVAAMAERYGSEQERRRDRVRADESGQALILALGGALAVIAGALALVAIAGAITGKGRAQRAADLAAISAVRSLRDDLPRLLAPARLANGLPNPGHLGKASYLARARQAALAAAKGNGVDPGRVRIDFPDADSFAPVQAEAEVLARVEGLGEGAPVEASAVAEAAAPLGAAGGMGMATGGGYSGPLAYRDGEGMRPDVAAGYDQLVAAAAAEGVAIVVVSGFRSDAEQAALFAAHPDPTWVAPPGKSLHRCATELDLGPESAYGWLAVNASRFGFLQRYSWEPWHFGWSRPPAPCAAAGDAVLGGGAGAAATTSLPSFVPPGYRQPLLRSGGRWNVSPALLAAQLMAESGFDPNAGSPAGAQGIAQFMPSTAASYGLTDPFDPVAAIDAQAHLMSDLLRQFGSPELALAAYNAGPGAVEPCNCIPPYPETQAYVTRIIALLGGAGGLLPSFEVRLIA